MQMISRLIWVFYKTHINHEIERGHCNLSNNTRLRVASLLMAGMKEDRIIEIFRGKDKQDRSYYLKRKDIRNIKDEFFLDDFDKEPSIDAKSVDLIVSKWKDDVIAYKPHGKVSPSFPDFDESDFFLTLMFPYQVQMTEYVKKENSVVTIDATHGMSNKLQLVTILTLDEWREGKPLAFCITQRTDIVALKYFFDAIKSKLGCPLLPRLVMTDDAPQFYNAWLDIMGGNPKKFLCAWHINKNWKQNLISKISDVDLRAETKDLLFNLRSELDLDSFEYLNEEFVDFLRSDEALARFLSYYLKTYYQRSEFWAFAKRLRKYQQPH